MFAAQAAALHNLHPVIISVKRKSVIYGAQYLHRPIPGITDTSFPSEITTIRRGTEAKYAERVYNDATRPTSWRRIKRVAPCWNLRRSYETAWNKFAPDIVDYNLQAQDVQEFEQQFELVISTVPLWTICDAGHKFESQPILVKRDLKGSIVVAEDDTRNLIVYNGTNRGKWYRASRIFGYDSVEAPSLPELAAEGGWESGFKVVGNNCDCHPNVVRAGRMGKWEAGVLTHNAFTTAVESISDQLGLVLGGSAESV